MNITIRLHGKEIVRKLPEAWDELSPRTLLYLSRKINYTDRHSLKVALLKRVIPRKYLKHLSDLHRYELCECLKWMESFPPFPLRKSFRLLFINKLYLDLPKMEMATCMEFLIADDYYNKYFDTGDKKFLRYLIATICRRKGSGESFIETGDVRTPLISRAWIIKNSWMVRFMPRWQKSVVLAYFSGSKEYVHKLYKRWLFDGGDKEPAGMVNFGWSGIFMSVAESGVFGNLEKVHRTNFHQVLQYCVKKKQDDEEKAKQFESTNSAY